MTLKRKIKYQLDYYLRLVRNVWRGSAVPAWLTGRAARGAYLVALAIISVAYICQVNAAAESGYQMRDLQNKVDSLREEIQKLDVEVASVNALPSLERNLLSTNMVKAENIVYLSATNLAVAKK